MNEVRTNEYSGMHVMRRDLLAVLGEHDLDLERFSIMDRGEVRSRPSSSSTPTPTSTRTMSEPTTPQEVVALGEQVAGNRELRDPERQANAGLRKVQALGAEAVANLNRLSEVFRQMEETLADVTVSPEDTKLIYELRLGCVKTSNGIGARLSLSSTTRTVYPR